MSATQIKCKECGLIFENFEYLPYLRWDNKLCASCNHDDDLIEQAFLMDFEEDDKEAGDK